MCAPRICSQRGFTFIELMVVIVIISIVLSINAPRLGSFYRSVKLNSAARSLQILLNHGRSQALNYRTPCQVRIDSDWQQLSLWRQQRVSGEDDADQAQFERLLSRAASFNLPAGIRLDEIVRAGTSISSGSEQRFEISPAFNSQETLFRLVGEDGDQQLIKISAGSGRAIILESEADAQPQS